MKKCPLLPEAGDWRADILEGAIPPLWALLAPQGVCSEVLSSCLAGEGGWLLCDPNMSLPLVAEPTGPNGWLVLECGAGSGARVCRAHWIWRENCSLAERLVKISSSPVPLWWHVQVGTGSTEPMPGDLQTPRYVCAECLYLQGPQGTVHLRSNFKEKTAYRGWAGRGGIKGCGGTWDQQQLLGLQGEREGMVLPAWTPTQGCSQGQGGGLLAWSWRERKSNSLDSFSTCLFPRLLPAPPPGRSQPAREPGDGCSPLRSPWVGREGETEQGTPCICGVQSSTVLSIFIVLLDTYLPSP